MPVNMEPLLKIQTVLVLDADGSEKECHVPYIKRTHCCRAKLSDCGFPTTFMLFRGCLICGNLYTAANVGTDIDTLRWLLDEVYDTGIKVHVAESTLLSVPETGSAIVCWNKHAGVLGNLKKVKDVFSVASKFRLDWNEELVRYDIPKRANVYTERKANVKKAKKKQPVAPLPKGKNHAKRVLFEKTGSRPSKAGESESARQARKARERMSAKTTARRCANINRADNRRATYADRLRTELTV